MDCEFKRIDIWRMARGETTICWELSPNFFAKGPFHFYVDFGFIGTDEWTALNTTPVIDDCCFIDQCQRSWEKLTDASYRIRLLLPNEPGCPVFKSQPVLANGRLARRDWLRAREIIRKEHLQQRKGGEGTLGFLLKRRKFGMRCPHCLEWDTKEVTDSDCTTCYGTGIVGGYYPGIEYYFTLGAQWNRRIDVGTPPRGTNSDINKQARCVLYPRIDTKDVWIRADNDERYIIDGYQVIAQMQGLPLVASAQMRLAPATDVVYAVPIEGASAAVELGEPACDVRKGLDSSYEDW